MRPLVPCRAALVLSVALFIATGAPHAFAADGFERLVSKRPAPAWLTPTAVDPTAPTNDAEASGGVSSLLDETRIRLTTNGVERYERYVDKAVSAAGVESLAEVTVDIEPEFEKLELHAVRILRDGKSIDALPDASVRMVQRESELERRMYLGTVTAYVVLSDVRVGDVIDVSYTIRGQNPVFGTRYAGTFSLGASVPTRLLKRQVIDGRADPVGFRALGDARRPRVLQGAQGRTLEWDLQDVLPEPVDDDQGSFGDGPWVQLSDFASWKDVAAWGAELYEAQGHTSSEIRELAESFRSASSERAEQALLAVRFVQDDVRYLSIQNGPHSHLPHHAAEVLKQRFGDCKDKSLLLVALLRELGFEAEAALVDTEMAGDVAKLLPSPAAFDHVIVLATVEGRKLWIDATASNQGGTLFTEVPANFGVALVMAPGVQELARMPVPKLERAQRDVSSSYLVKADGSADLRVITTYEGSEADATRDYLARTSHSDLARDSLDAFASEFAGVRTLQAPRATDDRRQNRLVIEEKYWLPRFWKNGHRDVESLLVRSYLPEPDPEDRSAPLELEHPVWVRERTQILLPHDAHLEKVDQESRSSAFSYEHHEHAAGRHIVVSDEYRSLADQLPAREVPRYMALLENVPHVLTLQRASGVSSSAASRPEASAPGRWTWFGLGVLSSLLVFVAAWALRLAARRPALVTRREASEPALTTVPPPKDTKQVVEEEGA